MLALGGLFVLAQLVAQGYAQGTTPQTGAVPTLSDLLLSLEQAQSAVCAHCVFWVEPSEAGQNMIRLDR